MVGNSLREEHETLEADITKMKDQFKGRGLAWGGVRGDSLVRIVRHYLWKHISSSVKLAKNAWVEGCGIEFDLMVVDRMSKGDNGVVANWHILYPTSMQQQYTEDLHQLMQMWE